MKNKIKSNVKNMGIAGIGLCALLCSLPMIGAGLGISALVAGAAYFEKIGTVIFLLSVGMLVWWFVANKRKKNAASCDVNCGCKVESSSKT